jgi:hypothetical protein
MTTSLKNLVVLAIALAAGTVFTAPAQAGLSTYYSDGTKSYSASFSRYLDKKDNTWNYNLNGSMHTQTSAVDNAGIGRYTNISDKTVRVYMDFSGTEGTAPASTLQGSQGISGTANGIQFYMDVSTGYYELWGDGKGLAPAPALYEAYGYGYLSFSTSESLIVNGNADFGTWISDYDEILTAHSYFNPHWDFTFPTIKGAGEFSKGLEAVGFYPATVPEPASLSVLAIGGMCLLTRRRAKS